MSLTQNITPPSPNWYLMAEGNIPACTFIPEVLALLQVVTPDGVPIRKYVRLMLHFKNGEQKEVAVPVSELEQIDWFELDSRCILNTQYRNINSCVANVIRAGLGSAPVDTRYSLDRLGIHRIDDQIVFAAGDRVVTRSHTANPNLSFELDQLSLRLDIDPDLTRREAFEGMSELISLSPEIGRVLVAHTISGLIRAAFRKAGILPCAVLVVVGESGMIKSHYVPHLVQLYNRAEEVRSVTQGIRKRNESTAEEIIRRISQR